jgi:hypothetical protein
MFTYRQSDGQLLHNGEFVGTGYSGHAAGRNNPAEESDQGIGPIPRGEWKIGPAYDHPHLGPCVMNLDPVGHDAHGRSAFRIHGNNAANDASLGCLVAGPTIRHFIRDSGDTDLEVVR